MRHLLSRIVCGFVIGIGAILPGVSGGVMAVSMGLYEDMVSAISDFVGRLKDCFLLALKKRWADMKPSWAVMKRCILFLIPLGVGGVIGVLLTSNVLKLFLEKYEAPVLALFCGLVLGSIPSLVMEAKIDRARGFRLRYVLAAVLGLACVLAFAFLESSVSSNTNVESLSFWQAVLAGAVLPIGVVIPGVSSSFILIYMGLYTAFLKAIAAVNIPVLLEAGVAFVLVSLVLIQLVNRMLKRHHTTSYFAIIGFVIGSVALILPSIIRGLTWSCPILFVAGLAASIFEGYYKARKQAVRQISADVEAAAAEKPEER